MNSQITFELAHVPLVKMQDVLLARFIGCSEAIKLSFAPVQLTRIATAISEISRNVIQHAGAPGEIRFAHLAEGNRTGIGIIVVDQGSGIDNPERYLQEGSSCALGAGLPGTRKLADRFQIQSKRNAGTTVNIEFWRAN